METLIKVIEKLRKRGYSEDFNLNNDNQMNLLQIAPFVIDNVYRFEESTESSNQSILYAISSYKKNMKGILITGAEHVQESN